MSAALHAHELVARRHSRGRVFELRIDTLALRAGETLAVLGPNGAGKTTLLRALAGLDPLVSGRVERAGAGAVTMVFQRPIALVGSVAHNLRVGLASLRLPRVERDERVTAALERFGIAELAERQATRLSGGELRRLALARAFALEPAVLLLDEPFEDLDVNAGAALLLDLRRAIVDTGVAVAVVTHDLRRATLLADRIAVLERGALCQVDERERVLSRPATPQVARLVGMTNLIPGVLRGREVQVDEQHRLVVHTDLPDGTAVYAGVRPEHLKLELAERGTRDPGRGDSAPIGKGVVREVRSDGVLVTVRIDWAGCELVGSACPACKSRRRYSVCSICSAFPAPPLPSTGASACAHTLRSNRRSRTR